MGGGGFETLKKQNKKKSKAWSPEKEGEKNCAFNWGGGGPPWANKNKLRRKVNIGYGNPKKGESKKTRRGEENTRPSRNFILWDKTPKRPQEVTTGSNISKGWFFRSGTSPNGCDLTRGKKV